MISQPKKNCQQKNESSLLLSPEENRLVFTLLGKGCRSLATAVVQVYLSDPPEHCQWLKHCCGIACLVKDNSRRSYFIRVYDMDNCQAGLNFADEKEAYLFQKVVNENIRSRVQNQSEMKQTENSCEVKSTQQTIMRGPPKNFNDLNKYPLKQKKKKKKNGSKQKLSKDEIGMPTNFRHVKYFGFDPNTGFHLGHNVDEQLKEFFSMAGVSEKQLQDNNTHTYICNFILEHGVIDAIQGNEEPKPLSNAPAPDVRKDSSGTLSPLPPPPLSSSSVPLPLPPPPLSSSSVPLPLPPPPLSSSGVPPPPHPPPLSSSGVPPPPHPPPLSSSGVPPPPSPPLSSFSVPPPPPPPPLSSSSVPPPLSSFSVPSPPPPPPLSSSSVPPPPPPPLSSFSVPPPPPPPPLSSSSVPLPPLPSPLSSSSVPLPSPPPLSSFSVPPLPPFSSSASPTPLPLLFSPNPSDEPKRGKRLQHIKMLSESEGSVSSSDPRGALLYQIRQGVKLRSVSEKPKSITPRSLPLEDLAGALARALQERSRVIQLTDGSDGHSDEDEENNDEWDC
ncbi:uncharacterized protein LOC143252996 isoform X2 [Tachypleus tridentatus]|uniref:uncharacterized protein LOC143252996 isoform X2 n=1 Tax=Tachypleus tridentatus TaxID=6853 RepID=UPI003FCF356E